MYVDCVHCCVVTSEMGKVKGRGGSKHSQQMLITAAFVSQN